MNVADLITGLLPQVTAVFPSIVRASVLGGCGLLLVVLLRLICGKQLAPASRLALWIPALLLLVIPRLPDVGFGLEPPVPAEPMMAEPMMAEPVMATVSSVDKAPLDAPPHAALVAESLPTPSGVNAPSSMTWMEIAGLLWAGIALLMVVGCVTAHQFWWRRVRRFSAPAPDHLAELFAGCCREAGLRDVPALMISRGLDNPVVTGLWRPAVVIPQGMEDALPRTALRHVLLHEAAHLRRHDLWWHWAWFVVLALHWFNPFLWLAVRLMRADREAACDAMVMGLIPGDARHAYGSTLLRLQERMALMATPQFCPGALGGGHMLKQRILDIVRHGQRSPRAAFVVMGLGIAGAGAMAGLAAEPPKAKAPDQVIETDLFGAKGAVKRGSEPGDRYFEGFRLWQIGMKLEAEGKKEAAMEKYVESSRILHAVQQSHPHWEKEVVAYRLKTIEEAIAALASVIPADPAPGKVSDAKEKVEETLKSAYAYYNLGEYDKAIKSFQDALRADPYNAAARRGMERAEAKRSELFDAARKHLREKMLDEVHPHWRDGENPGQYYAAKMEKIIFPEVKCVDATVEEMVEFLRIKSRDYDNVEQDRSKRGVNLIIKPGMPPSPAKITLDLKDVSMGEALRQIVQLAGMKYRVEFFAVVVTELNSGPELITGTIKVPVDFLKAAGGREKATAVEVLRAHGIPFPQGSSASYVPATSQLIVKNTAENVEKVIALVGKLMQAGVQEWKIAEAWIEVIPLEQQSADKAVDGKTLEEYIGTQLELLLGPTLRVKAQMRLSRTHPQLMSEPVMVTASRVVGTNLLTVAASSLNDKHAVLYLDSLLAERELLRQEELEKSLVGTIEKVREVVLQKEKEAGRLKEKLDTALRENASQEKMDKLKAQYDQAVEDYESWVLKETQIKASLEKAPPRLDIRILKRANPTPDDAR